MQSSIGCGGRSLIAFYPDSVEQLCMLLRGLEADGIPYRVLGNLTNVLPPDGETDFVVVSTKRLKGITFSKDTFAYAGEMSGSFLSACKKAQQGGAEFLNGIPCTLGGALYMNAGADGRYLSEIVESVLVFRDGKVCLLSQKECEYAYKKSIFMLDNSHFTPQSF
jgi:UDP-N-acetylmuramate dehydrogenase